ncbi:MAG: hypothetical protein LQ351_004684 [Letrouitia transgressa]|nr:MAG: hypothetical protein LQ351_004684 [Letrouitia transgressa]
MLAAAALEKGKIAPLYEDYNGNRMIRLRALQYMVIYDLQRVLAGQVSKIYSTSSAPPELMEKVRKTMKHYVCALRDLKYMLEAPSQHDAVCKFLIRRLYIGDSSSFAESAILTDAGFLESQETRRPKPFHLPNYTGYGGHNFSQQTAEQEAGEFFSRLRMALFGGVSLIAPMLIMKLHPTLLTQLVTTSVFILAVGIILAWYMRDAQKRDILAATATYAAVLVVFVGTTS